MSDAGRGNEKNKSEQATLSSNDKALVYLGKRIFQSKNCQQCHSINNRGGKFGPALDRLGSRANEQELLDEMQGGAEEPDMTFKSQHLTTADQQKIVRYILSVQKPKKKM